MITVFLVQDEPSHWVRFLADQVRRAGHRPVLLTAPLTAAQRGAAAETVDDVVEIDDITDAALLAAKVRELAGADGRIITASDAVLVATTEAAELLGVARTSASVFANIRDKHEARRTMRAAGLPCPEFALIHAADEARSVADAVGLPAIVKPVNGAGSHLIRVVRTVEELADAYRVLAERLPETTGSLYRRPLAGGIDPATSFLVERRLRGQEYCIDMVIRGGAVETFIPVGKPLMDDTFMEHLCLCPALDLTPELDVLLRTRATEAALAVGLDDTVAHVELIDDADLGPTVVEVNAGRPGGGLVWLLHELSSGVGLFAELLAATLGEPPPPRSAAKVQVPLAYGMILGHGNARLIDIHGLDDVAALPEVLDVVRVAEPGQLLSDDREVFAVNVLFAGYFDLEECVAVYEEINKLIQFEVEPVGGAVL